MKRIEWLVVAKGWKVGMYWNRHLKENKESQNVCCCHAVVRQRAAKKTIWLISFWQSKVRFYVLDNNQWFWQRRAHVFAKVLRDQFLPSSLPANRSRTSTTNWNAGLAKSQQSCERDPSKVQSVQKVLHKCATLQRFWDMDPRSRKSWL